MPDTDVVGAAKSDKNLVTVIAAARNGSGQQGLWAITNWLSGGGGVPRRWPCQCKSWNRDLERNREMLKTGKDNATSPYDLAQEFLAAEAIGAFPTIWHIGKSTVARVQTQLLGRANVASPSIRDLSNYFGLWGLLDKKLAIIPDAVLPRPCPALEELLKSVSGEDAVDIHRKGLPPLTGIRLGVRLMVLANELPAFQDPSGALGRRLITLRTARSFMGKEDVHLTDKLLAELPGILNWAIDGLCRLTAQGRFSDPNEHVGDPHQTISTDTTSVDGNGVNIAAKLQQAKKAMAERCERVGKAILDEAGVKKVQYHDRLCGRAFVEDKLVFIPKPTTRRRLYVVAHEAGHVALNHSGNKPQHRKEYEAEKYAHDALRRHGISVPKKETQRGKRYVARKISQALRRGAKTIDRESFKWCGSELSNVDQQRIKSVVLVS